MCCMSENHQTMVDSAIDMPDQARGQTSRSVRWTVLAAVSTQSKRVRRSRGYAFDPVKGWLHRFYGGLDQLGGNILPNLGWLRPDWDHVWPADAPARTDAAQRRAPTRQGRPLRRPSHDAPDRKAAHLFDR